jgi:hypothetical protein
LSRLCAALRTQHVRQTEAISAIQKWVNRRPVSAFCHASPKPNGLRNGSRRGLPTAFYGSPGHKSEVEPYRAPAIPLPTARDQEDWAGPPVVHGPDGQGISVRQGNFRRQTNGHPVFGTGRDRALRLQIFRHQKRNGNRDGERPAAALWASVSPSRDSIGRSALASLRDRTGSRGILDLAGVRDGPGLGGGPSGTCTRLLTREFFSVDVAAFFVRNGCDGDQDEAGAGCLVQERTPRENSELGVRESSEASFDCAVRCALDSDCSIQNHTTSGLRQAVQRGDGLWALFLKRNVLAWSGVKCVAASRPFAFTCALLHVE